MTRWSITSDVRCTTLDATLDLAAGEVDITDPAANAVIAAVLVPAGIARRLDDDVSDPPPTDEAASERPRRRAGHKE